MRNTYLIVLLLLGRVGFSQTLPTENYWQQNYWTAKWIAHPTAAGKAYGIYHFRKTIELAKKPERFVIHVSADNRYELFVNGKAVSAGPARSNWQSWYYETIDLAPYLKNGVNTLAAQVWNMGEGAPAVQMSYQTAFILQGDTDSEKLVNTNESWKVYQNPAYTPIKNDIAKFSRYIVVGDGDRVDGATYPWGWQQPVFNEQTWLPAANLRFKAKPRALGSDGFWQLTPRTIPMASNGLNGPLQFAEGKLPHQQGEIVVRFDRTSSGGLTGSVTLPATLAGSLQWNGKTIPLKSGKQVLRIP